MELWRDWLAFLKPHSWSLGAELEPGQIFNTEQCSFYYFVKPTFADLLLHEPSLKKAKNSQILLV